MFLRMNSRKKIRDSFPIPTLKAAILFRLFKKELLYDGKAHKVQQRKKF